MPLPRNKKLNEIEFRIDKTEEQLSLFSEHHEREESLENAMDKIKEKYGYDSITLAGKLNLHY